MPWTQPPGWIRQQIAQGQTEHHHPAAIPIQGPDGVIWGVRAACRAYGIPPSTLGGMLAQARNGRDTPFRYLLPHKPQKPKAPRKAKPAG